MIIVLTYKNPHRKTQDLVLKLLAHGIKFIVVATEWVERKNFEPLIQHRPANPMNISLTEFCINLGVKLILTSKAELYDTLNDIKDIDYILLATGNIIEERIVEKFRVINSHPGYLPIIKGLDALKWAVYHKEKIGVTTHFVNTQIDGGIMIERNIVPLYPGDTFHNLAYRQYEMEVDMLINSIKVEPLNIEITESKYGTFRRMPNRLEPEMLEKFEEMKKEAEATTN